MWAFAHAHADLSCFSNVPKVPFSSVYRVLFILDFVVLLDIKYRIFLE